MSSPEINNAPAALLEAIESYAHDPAEVTWTKLAGGEINSTYLLESEDGQKLILQQLNPAFGTSVVEDSTAVGDLMVASGWKAPQTVPTRNGELVHVDQNGIDWRATTFVESSPAPEASPTPEDFASYGNILGRWHADMGRSNYEPKHELPHFHETEFYAGRLTDLQNQMPDAETGEMAARLLAEYHALPALPASPDQLLHGDPRTSNMLFNENGEPFTIIDLDTIMKGPIWIDIGDAMRSLAEDAVGRGDVLTEEQLRSYTEGYLKGSGADYDTETFVAATVVAMKRIAIELSMRYANDIVDDNYFDWDKTAFDSRRDNHMARIATQMKIFTMFNGSVTKE